jgi:hypothetical protein
LSRFRQQVFVRFGAIFYQTNIHDQVSGLVLRLQHVFSAIAQNRKLARRTKPLTDGASRGTKERAPK